MTSISRRGFLAGLGAAGGSLAVGGYALTTWRNGSPVPDATGASPATSLSTSIEAAAPAGRTLVILELDGGNDSLNTVVPFADPAYRKLRPTLGVTDPIPLDSTVGFAPEMSKLAARYRAGHVAIIDGLGFPDPDLSHFASLARWWAGTPTPSDGTGWVGRYLDRTVGVNEPLAGITISSALSPTMIGANSYAVSIVDRLGLSPRPPTWVGSADAYVDSWGRFALAPGDPMTPIGPVQAAIATTLDARAGLGTALAGFDEDTPDELDGVDGAAAGSSMVARLRLAAQLVAAADAPRVIIVSANGDFDTHESIVERHPPLLASIDTGIEAFFVALAKAGVGDKAVLMTTSEFGRRAAENGSGTDHGTAASHLVVGPAVRGGRYGEPPSLTRLDAHDNLVATTDPRRLYASVLDGWLRTDPDPIIGAGFAPLPLFA